MKKEKTEQELRDLIQKYNILEQKNRSIKYKYTDELNVLYEIPKYKNFIGKYFKYKNSYSGEKHQFIYIKVIDILVDKYNINFKISRFEITANKEIEILIDDVVDTNYLFETEISEKEYNTQKNKLLEKISKL